jgi:hypothetical protein
MTLDRTKKPDEYGPRSPFSSSGYWRYTREKTLAVECPICGKLVRAKVDPSTFEDPVAGNISEGSAKKTILSYHVRHKHANYKAEYSDDFYLLDEEESCLSLRELLEKVRERGEEHA